MLESGDLGGARVALRSLAGRDASELDESGVAAAVIESLERYQREGVWEQAQSVGITDKAEIEAMTYLHNASMRGLAIELMFSKDTKKAGAAMKLLKRYKSWLTGQLVTKPFD